MRANGLSSTSIYAGQALVIPPADSAPPPAQAQPTKQPQPPTQPAPGAYTVQSGDSLIGLANKFGVTQQALAAANGLQAFDHLFIGQVLKIPGASQPQPQPTAAPAAPATATHVPVVPVVQSTTTPQPVTSAQNAQPGKPAQYTVQVGDSLSTIASKFNTTVDSLMSLNKLTDRNFLRLGQVLTVIKGDDQNNNPPITVPTSEPTPPIGQFGPKWVDVNLTTETMIAFEGQTPVFSSKISSGVALHPTVQGISRIYAK
jgi:LysM repeat protein